MNGLTRTVVSGLGAIALATTSLTAPAVAAPAGADLMCQYKLDNKLHQVSGKCQGQTDHGSAKGSFKGKLRPGGSAKGKLSLDGPTGKFKGSFKGSSFNGGKAKGSFSVSLGSLNIDGSFVAIIG